MPGDEAPAGHTGWLPGVGSIVRRRGGSLVPRAVRFDEYGGVDVLQVVEVPRPVPGVGEVVVAVEAAGINPGEAKIREGLLHSRWPATFPSGEGSDLAGVVDELGPGVDSVSIGDDVIGFTHGRASHAELVAVEAVDLTPKPPGVPWEVAGALFVAGTTAWAAVRAVAAGPRDVVVVSAAAGGVGSFTVQLLRRAGATVVGLAGPANHDWLAQFGVLAVEHGDGAEQRVRDAAGGRVDAFIDLYGPPYVDMAISLGVRPERIDTVVDWNRAAAVGAKVEGNAAGASAAVLAELAGLAERGELTVPIAATFPLDEVQAAFRLLEEGHTRGKIVLLP
jgi:NADPH:quinone reductase-like Zn-dependent oxidoreductase